MASIVAAAAAARQEESDMMGLPSANRGEAGVPSEREMLTMLKLHGLHAVTADAVQAMRRQISRESNPREALKTLAHKLAARTSSERPVVDGSVVMEVVAAETRNEEDTKQEAYSIVSSFDFPRWSYDAARKSYFCAGTKFPLHGPAAAKIAVFGERLALVEARLKRNPTFAPPIAGSLRKDHVQLTAIDVLPALAAAAEHSSSSSAYPGASGGGMGDGSASGSGHGIASSVNLLGMLTQPEEGVWCLEDGQKSVRLDLSSPSLQRLVGFYTEMSVVLVSGDYDPDADAAHAATADSGAGADGDSGDDGSKAAAAVGGASTSTTRPAGTDAFGFASSGASSASSAGASAPHHKFSSPLVDGRVPGLLRVSFICHPPHEERSASLSAMGNVGDVFGVITSPAEYQRALKLESGGRSNANANAMQVEAEDAEAFDEERAAADAVSFVTVSDVHLDLPSTFEHLRAMLDGFSGYNSMPALLVLMGNFTSKPFGQAEGGLDRDRYRGHMASLAALLRNYEEAFTQAGTCVVIVPGPNDPGTNGCLPRPPIPSYFAQPLLSLASEGVAKVALMSNPCRVRYYTQELVFFRCDLTAKLKRRSILQPMRSPALKPEHHLLRTILGQGHLCPLPLQAQPVYWEVDHSLRLGPHPDVLVIAEGGNRRAYGLCGEPKRSGSSSSGEEAGAGAGGAAASVAPPGFLLFNPGSFAKTSGFFMYRPSRRVGEVLKVVAGHGEDSDDGHD